MSATRRRASALRLERNGELMRWTDRTRSAAELGAETLGQPGLWRRIRRRGRVLRVFECPAPGSLSSTHDLAGRRDDRGDLESELQEWVDATSRGERPPDWKAPPSDEVASWLAPERLCVRAGAHLAKGALESSADHLRLHFPEVVRLAAELPDGRRAWLRELCLDAQSRWQLVRFGVSGDRVRAEVDLSGVPLALSQPLFTRAVEALVFTVGWALPALALVSDASVESRTLDGGPWWRQEDLPEAAPADPARSPALADAPSQHRTGRRAVRA